MRVLRSVFFVLNAVLTISMLEGRVFAGGEKFLEGLWRPFHHEIFEDLSIKSVKVLVLVPTEEGGRYLVAKKNTPNDERRHKTWELLGGRPELGDKNVYATLRRELREEEPTRVVEAALRNAKKLGQLKYKLTSLNERKRHFALTIRINLSFDSWILIKRAWNDRGLKPSKEILSFDLLPAEAFGQEMDEYNWSPMSERIMAPSLRGLSDLRAQTTF